MSFVMTAENLLTVDVSDPLSAVRRLLTENPIHHIPVLDGNSLVGIISPTDLLRVGVGLSEADDDSLLDARFTAGQVMERRLVTLHPKDNLLVAAERLSKESFSSLPVVDEAGELIGILTTRDLLRVMVAAER